MTQTMSIDDAVKHASALFNQGQLQDSEIICNSILEKYPSHADANHILGVIAFKVNKVDMAIELFKKAIKANKKNPEYYSNIGNAYKENGDTVNAIKSFRKSLSLNDAIAKTHYNLANIYYEKNNLSEAKKHYFKAIKLNPGYAQALNNLATIYRDGGDFKKAEPYFIKAIESNPDYALAMNNLAITYDGLGEFEKARDNYLRAVELKPDYFEAFYNLGNLYQSHDDNTNAIKAYERAIAINPQFVEAINNVAVSYDRAGEDEKAVENFIKAVAVDPLFKYSYLNYGNLFRKAGMYDEAIKVYKKAIDLDPLFEDVYFNIGCAYADSETPDKSIEYFNKVISINPLYAPAHKNLGNVYKDYGEFSKAEHCFREAIKINPAYTEAYRELSSVVTLDEDDKEVAMMHDLLHLDEANDEQKMHVAYALGKVYEDMKDYEKSFHYLSKANGFRRNRIAYDAEDVRSMFSEIKLLFNQFFIKNNLKYGSADKTPVFIVGMPRSGSSLIEQILATHSQVFGGGELEYISTLVNKKNSIPTGLDYPACVSNISGALISEMATEYLKLIRKFSKTATYITDKMPHNFMYIGLIKILFPNAKIIHTKRDPMDNCLSLFKKGFFDGHAYADNLQDLGEYYRMYEDLMNHWHKILSDSIYDIVYEDVVSHQEEETRRLLDYCELPWDENCLSFYKTERKVHTASATQVRSGIYQDSVKLWKRYEKQLQPLKHSLKLTES